MEFSPDVTKTNEVVGSVVALQRRTSGRSGAPTVEDVAATIKKKTHLGPDGLVTGM